MSSGPWSPPAAANPYLDSIIAMEARYVLPPMLLARLLYQESRYRPEVIDGRVRGLAGEIGIAQFMPDTAADLGVDPFDPESSIEGAGRYLAELYDQFGDWTLALAAYNWGQGNVRRKGISQVPQSSIDYASSILTDVNAFG